MWLTSEQQRFIGSLSIPVEICPSSNAKTLKLATLSDHPTAGMWLKEYHPFCICTDDTAVFDTSLSQEYEAFAEAFQVDRPYLVLLAVSATNFIFQNSDFKAQLRDSMNSECRALRL